VKYIATVDSRDFTIDVDQAHEVVVDGATLPVNLKAIDGQLYSLLLGNRSHEVFVERSQGIYYVLIAGDRYAVDVEDAHLKHVKVVGSQAHETHGTTVVLAPMPGLVMRVLVTPGEAVLEGQGVVILEAMKMENEIRAPRTGVVQTVHVVGGKAVNQGDALLVVGDAE
jgi:biotin carboxyl carrier protein